MRWASSAGCDMVESMKEDLDTPSSGGPSRRKENSQAKTSGPGSQARLDADPAADSFEQLSLDSTVVGPGMRSEDHYERGDRLKIKGERGVFIYKHASISRSGLVSLHLSGADGSRAVRPDQVLPIRKRSKRF